MVAEFGARATGDRAADERTRRAAEAAAEEQAGRPHPDARLARIRPPLRAADAAAGRRADDRHRYGPSDRLLGSHRAPALDRLSLHGDSDEAGSGGERFRD